MEHTEARDILAAGAAIAGKEMDPILNRPCGTIPFVIIPDGYSATTLDHLLPEPTRKRGKVVVSDASSFCGYVNCHSAGGSLVYADIDQIAGSFTLVAVINDHSRAWAGWRDHTCTMSRKQSVEWQRWMSKDKKAMPQAEFAAWIEENLTDIASVEGMPSGSDMLGMALGFERTSEKRLKSRVNLQSGGFRLEYVDDEDKDTRTSMEVFSRFSIGIPVFECSAAAYRIDARLKYRESGGKLSFWFELIRPDKAFRQAVDEEVAFIAAATELPIINGKAGI
jgi:uncharacterized protein YfdQ (DUF2303 family)